ncbi:MAG TPA: tetraacyldisaccharide 4'-kinase, partial [Woeseiaceae bacterium]|nr:tetraacyldisaccharide 4'-kinase [Woeseiaceae bacterium]
VNGGVRDTAAYRFELVASEACRLNGSLARPLEGFRNKTVHAVAAIGNPQRFFDTLREHGIQVIEHAFPDHQPIVQSALRFGDDFNVFMTEKDAVKLGRNLGDKYWYVPVEFEMEPVRAMALLDQVIIRLQQARESHD